MLSFFRTPFSSTYCKQSGSSQSTSPKNSFPAQGDGHPHLLLPVQSSCGSLVLLIYFWFLVLLVYSLFFILFKTFPLFLPAQPEDLVLFLPRQLSLLGHQQPLYLVSLGSSPDLPWLLPASTPVLQHRVRYVLTCIFGEGSFS